MRLLTFAFLLFRIASASEVEVSVSPKRVLLTHPRDGIQLVVTGKHQDGSESDLTHSARIDVPAIIRSEDGFLTSLKSGKGVVKVTHSGGSVEVPVEVDLSGPARPVSFRNDVLAVLTKQGCNSGSCHGKPNGRGALELSLNAFDPKLDEQSLTESGLARFTDPLVPEESLLLKKPSLRVPHGGGKRLRPDGLPYQILHQWIYEGGRAEESPAIVCTGIDVHPSSKRVIHIDGDNRSGTQQFRVTAVFSDGSRRDVTRTCSWTVSHDGVGEVSADGRLTGLARGQLAVSVRFLDHVQSVPVTVVEQVEGFKWSDPPAANVVDTHILRKLRQLQYLPSEICDDSTFFRRLSLDVRGLLPTSQETRAFLSDDAADKRSRLIDRWLKSDEHAAWWSLRTADLLRVNRERLSPERARAFSEWIRESWTSNQPYDEFVSELLTASGKTSDVPAANFYRLTDDTKMVAETVAQLFMGSRIMCAQCHNHPYEKWTQDNYYQIAAAFHQVDRKLWANDAEITDEAQKRKLDRKSAEQMIALTADRTMTNPRTGIVQPPWPTNVERQEAADFRRAFAHWLTQPDNPYFARVAVNRIWAQLFGRGLVEPIDDFRSSNPAVNIDALDALATEFEHSGYDKRHIIRLILNSNTYQRSVQTNQFNETDDALCSHAHARLLSAEQIQDAITRVCLGPAEEENLAGQVIESEAIVAKVQAEKSDDETLKVAREKLKSAQQRQADYFMTQQAYPHLTTFLKAFGQPERKTACACERREEVSLDQALQFMNSSLIRGRVAKGATRLEALSDEQAIHELYLVAYSRRPSAKESGVVVEYLREADNRRQALEDIVWSILNSNEFMFQH